MQVSKKRKFKTNHFKGLIFLNKSLSYIHTYIHTYMQDAFLHEWRRPILCVVSCSLERKGREGTHFPPHHWTFLWLKKERCIENPSCICIVVSINDSYSSISVHKLHLALIIRMLFQLWVVNCIPGNAALIVCTFFSFKKNKNKI